MLIVTVIVILIVDNKYCLNITMSNVTMSQYKLFSVLTLHKIIDKI